MGALSSCLFGPKVDLKRERQETELKRDALVSRIGTLKKQLFMYHKSKDKRNAARTLSDYKKAVARLNACEHKLRTLDDAEMAIESAADIDSIIDVSRATKKIVDKAIDPEKADEAVNSIVQAHGASSVAYKQLNMVNNAITSATASDPSLNLNATSLGDDQFGDELENEILSIVQEMEEKPEASNSTVLRSAATNSTTSVATTKRIEKTPLLGLQAVSDHVLDAHEDAIDRIFSANVPVVENA